MVLALGTRAAIGGCTVAVTLLAGCAPRTATAGFWYEDAVVALPARAAEQIGGPLTDGELASIKIISRAEVERAFTGLHIRIVDDRSAFWRVEVVRSLRAKGPLPNAGESMPLGFMGGSGAVSFDLVAFKAIQYAPAGATRQTILEGIGRGIGRVAAHELGHQILSTGLVHDKDDENSYEYPSPDRAAQYYGALHWSTARPLLERRLR